MVPRLREDGWIVDIADDFPFRIVTAQGPQVITRYPSQEQNEANEY